MVFVQEKYINKYIGEIMMRFKRLWWTIRLCMIGDSMKRADYVRTRDILWFCWEKCVHHAPYSAIIF